ncbi:MAG TPA: hypothetical protein VL098_12980 [Flavipsychrobacter sp.]|nr:hypothetical protein [Flavipsychrobacter sp.]
MKENELIELLKNEVEKHELPFNDSDWQALRTRLDKGREKRVLVLPAYIKLLGAGLAASLLFFVLLFKQAGTQHAVEQDVAGMQPGDQRKQPVPGKTAPALAESATTSSSKEPKQGLSRKVTVTGKSLPYIQDTPSPEDSFMNSSQSESLAEPAPILAADPTRSGIPKKTMAEPKNYPQDVMWRDEEVLAQAKPPIFSGGGGINYQSQNIGYAVKLGLDKPLSQRWSVSAALAVNTNNRSFYQNEVEKIQQVVDFTSTGNMTTRLDTSYRGVEKAWQQTFAQAIVGVNYKLYSRGKAGMGVDAFRLMESRNRVEDYNELMRNDKPTALWNFGVRVQYTQYLTNHFDVGASYRQDVSSVLSNSWENNFLQFMLIYKLNKDR